MASAPWLCLNAGVFVCCWGSYQWNHQTVVLRVVEALQLRLYDVWVDVQQMSGSTVDAMARAVEGASVVLVCVSRAYKESSNCRLEVRTPEAIGARLRLVFAYHSAGCTCFALCIIISERGDL
eukprot:SAG11_NODE_8785_length_976_cov_428.427594_2_plen_123_part_00